MRVLAVLLAVLPAAAAARPAPGAAKPRSEAAKSARARPPAARAEAPKAARSRKAGRARTEPGKAEPGKAEPAAKPGGARGKAAKDPLGSCTAALTARKVAWRPASRPGIVHGVEITGRLGGVSMTSPSGPLVIDCSLAISLDEAGRYFRNVGLDAATFSSAYSRRTVRGTNRPSKHSYGLAIDVQAFSGPDIGTLHVDRDYEQGLGDAVDCLGRPLTQGGATLKLLQCQLARSGLFYLVLSPDYDDAHHDHFHLEVKPWSERAALRVETPAVH